MYVKFDVRSLHCQGLVVLTKIAAVYGKSRIVKKLQNNQSSWRSTDLLFLDFTWSQPDRDGLPPNCGIGSISTIDNIIRKNLRIAFFAWLAIHNWICQSQRTAFIVEYLCLLHRRRKSDSISTVSD